MPDFILGYQNEESENRAKRVDTTGAQLWDEPGRDPWSNPLIRVGEGYAIPVNFDGYARFNAAGVEEWLSSQPLTGAWNAAADADGNIYSVGKSDDTIAIYKTDPTGAVTTLATATEGDVGVTPGQVGFGITITTDQSIAIITHRGWNGIAGSLHKLVAFDLTTGAHLWTHQVSESWGTGGFPIALRDPASDSIFTATTFDDGAFDQVMVCRFDFPTGVANGPTLSWSELVTDDSVGYKVTAAAVNGDRVIVGYDWVSTLGGTPHCATALTHAGSVAWRFNSQMVADWSIGATDDAIVIGSVSGSRFPGTGTGFTLLDPATGSEVTAGVFPLQVGWPGGIAGAPPVGIEGVATLANTYHVLSDSLRGAYANVGAVAWLRNTYDNPTPALASLVNLYDNRPATRLLTNRYGNVTPASIPARAVIEAGVKLS